MANLFKIEHPRIGLCAQVVAADRCQALAAAMRDDRCWGEVPLSAVYDLGPIDPLGLKPCPGCGRRGADHGLGCVARAERIVFRPMTNGELTFMARRSMDEGMMLVSPDVHALIANVMPRQHVLPSEPELPPQQMIEWSGIGGSVHWGVHPGVEVEVNHLATYYVNEEGLHEIAGSDYVVEHHSYGRTIVRCSDCGAEEGCEHQRSCDVYRRHRARLGLRPYGVSPAVPITETVEFRTAYEAMTRVLHNGAIPWDPHQHEIDRLTGLRAMAPAPSRPRRSRGRSDEVGRDLLALLGDQHQLPRRAHAADRDEGRLRERAPPSDAQRPRRRRGAGELHPADRRLLSRGAAMSGDAVLYLVILLLLIALMLAIVWGSTLRRDLNHFRRLAVSRASDLEHARAFIQALGAENQRYRAVLAGRVSVIRDAIARTAVAGRDVIGQEHS